MKFVRIKLDGGGSYVQPITFLDQILSGEIDNMDTGDKLTLEMIELTQEEYEKLPEFTGH